MTFIEILATVLGTATGLANIPQIIKIFKTRSAKDLAITTQILFTLSSIVWLIYGIELNNYPLIIANIIYILTYSLIILGFMIYHKK